IVHAAITARFGDELLRDGYTAVPNLLLKYMAPLGLSFGELVLIEQVWYHWWFERLPYPSVETIARRMGLKERAARAIVKSLVDKTLLTKKPRFVRGLGQVASEWDFEPLLNALRGLDRRLNPEAYESERLTRAAQEPDPVNGWRKDPARTGPSVGRGDD